jgi:hypothetical protein
VRKVNQKVGSCTQQDVELHVQKVTFQNIKFEGWEYNLAVECVFSMHEALGLRHVTRTTVCVCVCVCVCNLCVLNSLSSCKILNFIS